MVGPEDRIRKRLVNTTRDPAAASSGQSRERACSVKLVAHTEAGSLAPATTSSGTDESTVISGTAHLAQASQRDEPIDASTRSARRPW